MPLLKIIKNLNTKNKISLWRFKLIKFKFVLFRKTIRVAFRNARRYNIERTCRDGIDQLPVGLSNTVHRHAKLIRPRPPGGLCPKHTRHRNQFLLRVSGHQIFQRCSVSITPPLSPRPAVSTLFTRPTRANSSYPRGTNFSAGGPFSMVTGYLSEFHSAKYKANFTRWGGLAVNAAIIVPASKQFLFSALLLNSNSLGHFDGIKKKCFFKRNLGIVNRKLEGLTEVRIGRVLSYFIVF